MIAGCRQPGPTTFLLKNRQDHPMVQHQRASIQTYSTQCQQDLTKTTSTTRRNSNHQSKSNSFHFKDQPLLWDIESQIKGDIRNGSYSSDKCCILTLVSESARKAQRARCKVQVEDAPNRPLIHTNGYKFWGAERKCSIVLIDGAFFNSNSKRTRGREGKSNREEEWKKGCASCIN